MRASDLAQDISREHLRLSNELMFKSIKASMEQVQEEVSVMVEILEALQLELTTDSEEKMI